jgi:hypothetical protein
MGDWVAVGRECLVGRDRWQGLAVVRERGLGDEGGIGWVGGRRSGRGSARMESNGWEDEEDRVVVIEEKEVVGVNAGGAVGRGWKGAVHNVSKSCRKEKMRLTFSLVSRSSTGQASISISRIKQDKARSCSGSHSSMCLSSRGTTMGRSQISMETIRSLSLLTHNIKNRVNELQSIYHKTRNIREGSVERRVPRTLSIVSSRRKRVAQQSRRQCTLEINEDQTSLRMLVSWEDAGDVEQWVICLISLNVLGMCA